MENLINIVKEKKSLITGAIELAILLATVKLFWESRKSKPKSLFDLITSDEDDLNVRKEFENLCNFILQKVPDFKTQDENTLNPLDIERDDQGQTALMVACRNSKSHFAMKLIDCGASVELASTQGWKPIHLACLSEKGACDKIVEHLLAHNPNLANTPDIFNNQWYPLLIATSKNNINQVKMLLDHGANVDAVNSAGQSPLIIAACNGAYDIAKLLVEKNADLNLRTTQHRQSALYFSCLNKHVTIARLLIEKGADLEALTSTGASALHAACLSGSVELVSLLIEKGADVNCQKVDYSQPIHIAALKGHKEISLILLENKAKVNGRTRFGKTPLHEAAFVANYEIVELLLRYGVDINVVDNDGLTALHTVCNSVNMSKKPIEDHLQVADLLITNGAQVNLQFNGNCTALHCAACGGDKTIPLVEFLLSKGADPTIESAQEWTPLHSACSTYGCPESAKLMKDAVSLTHPHFLSTFDPNKPKNTSNRSNNEAPPSSLTDQEKSEVLNGKVSLKGIAEKISSGKCKKIVVLTGAGISVNAGIPDFRNPKSGIYSKTTMEQYNLPSPAAAFDPNYLRDNPEPFFDIVRRIFLPVVQGKIKPTKVHYFMKMLNDKGILLRNYTQNIDTLEKVAGLPDDKVVESHGSFENFYCSDCHKPYDTQTFWNRVSSSDIPLCDTCQGVVRPSVVFFGEPLPSKFNDRIKDLQSCDLLIVMGSSLVVYPFAGLVNEVRESTPRLLLNKEPVGVFTKICDENDPVSREHNYRDVAWIGDCDEGVEKLVQLLGWEDELKKLMNKQD